MALSCPVNGRPATQTTLQQQIPAPVRRMSDDFVPRLFLNEHGVVVFFKLAAGQARVSDPTDS